MLFKRWVLVSAVTLSCLLSGTFGVETAHAAVEILVVTRSGLALRGDLVEVQADFIRLRTNRGVFRVPLKRLNSESVEMLNGLSADLIKQINEQPLPSQQSEGDQEREKIDFAAINYSDWDVAADAFLKFSLPFLKTSQGIQTSKTNRVILGQSPKNKSFQKLLPRIESLEGKLLLDKKIWTEAFEIPPHLKEYHRLVAEIYDDSLSMYQLALDGEQDPAKAKSRDVLLKTRSAYIELLMAYGKVAAPEEKVEEIKGIVVTMTRMLFPEDEETEGDRK